MGGNHWPPAAGATAAVGDTAGGMAAAWVGSGDGRVEAAASRAYVSCACHGKHLLGHGICSRSEYIQKLLQLLCCGAYIGTHTAVQGSTTLERKTYIIALAMHATACKASWQLFGSAGTRDMVQAA